MTMLRGLLDRVLALLPAGTQPTTVVDDGDYIPSVLLAKFDPTCAGSIERCWPEIFRLCAECGCTAVLRSTDRYETTSVLSTESAAPDFLTRNEHEVLLTLSRAEEMRVAA